MEEVFQLGDDNDDDDSTKTDYQTNKTQANDDNN